MKIQWLPMAFTVCQTADGTGIDFSAPYTFFARTEEEYSLVCPTDACPQNTLRREDGWRCFRVQGTLDFSLVGILAKITGCLAAQGIPVFAVSTYQTDYVLVKADQMDRARRALQEICLSGIRSPRVIESR